MPDNIDLERGPGIAERFFGGWRVIVSAWLVAIVVVVLFAGVQALASFHGVSPRQQNLAGAVIPRHDPSCAGPQVFPTASQNCQGESNALATAESAAYYGW